MGKGAILGGISLLDFVCQLLSPTKTKKKMDLYEEKPVLELSGGADGPRLCWVPVLYFAS